MGVSGEILSAMTNWPEVKKVANDVWIGCRLNHPGDVELVKDVGYFK